MKPVKTSQQKTAVAAAVDAINRFNERIEHLRLDLAQSQVAAEAATAAIAQAAAAGQPSDVAVDNALRHRMRADGLHVALENMAQQRSQMVTALAAARVTDIKMRIDRLRATEREILGRARPVLESLNRELGASIDLENLLAYGGSCSVGDLRTQILHLELEKGSAEAQPENVGRDLLKTANEAAAAEARAV
jgi:hypothetical protein